MVQITCKVLVTILVAISVANCQVRPRDPNSISEDSSVEEVVKKWMLSLPVGMDTTNEKRDNHDHDHDDHDHADHIHDVDMDGWFQYTDANNADRNGRFNMTMSHIKFPEGTGVIEGSGKDQVGDFTVTGHRLDGNKIEFDKTYKDIVMEGKKYTFVVVYEGSFTPAANGHGCEGVIDGDWTMTHLDGITESNIFQLDVTEHHHHVTQAPPAQGDEVAEDTGNESDKLMERIKQLMEQVRDATNELSKLV